MFVRGVHQADYRKTVEVSEFLKTPEYDGPTRKGLRFRADLIDQMVQGIAKVKGELGSAEAS